MRQLFAQNFNIGGQEIQGPLNLGIDKTPDQYTLADVIGKVTQFLFPLAAVILFFVLVWGGYDFLMSQGNADKVKSAQAKITTGLIGFFLLIISYVLTRIIASIFGLEGGLF